MSKLTRRIQLALSPERGEQIDKVAHSKSIPTATMIRSIVYQYLDKVYKG